VTIASKRNYRKEYDNYHKKPKQRVRNAARKQARRDVAKRYGELTIKGKDVDHKDRDPTNNTVTNLRIQSVRKNRKRNS